MEKQKILIVEDELDMAYAIQLRLENHNFEVLVAHDGQSGLEKARSENPDLIILDLILPKIDGYKVCRMLKFDKRYKHIPIIMLTACGQDSDKKTGLEVGANIFLTKPFEPELLLKTINSLLEKTNP